MLQVELSDSPVKNATQDLYGITRFAESIANCIRSIKTPVGTVIAINGAWGSGKTSVLNLIRNNLDDNCNIVKSEFKCWWFKSDSEIILSFFDHLGSILTENFDKKIIDSFLDIVKKGFPLLKIAADIGDSVTSPVTGTIIRSAVELFQREIFKNGTLEQKIDKLTIELQERSLSKKILIIIDDIDRLSPDEMMTLFRLVKTVGQLPGVIFLLAFDKNIANKVVDDYFHVKDFLYLEKIIQVSFDVPVPLEASLQYWLYAGLMDIMRINDSEEVSSRYSHAYQVILKKYIKTPRNVKRLLNSVSVTWPAIRNEVNCIDFISLETIRIFDNDLFTFISHNHESLNDFSYQKSSIDELLTRRKRVLKRDDREIIYFFFNRDDKLENLRLRSFCLSRFLWTYFLCDLVGPCLPDRVVRALIQGAGKDKFIKRIFRRAKKVTDQGNSQVSLYMDELIANVRNLKKEDINSLIRSLVELYDELFDKDDIGNLEYGLPRDLAGKYLLFFEQLLELKKITSDNLFNILLDVLSSCSVSLLAYIGLHEENNKKVKFFSDGDFNKFKAAYLERIRCEINNGLLIKQKQLVEIIFFENSCGNQAKKEIYGWVLEIIKKKENLVLFISALMSYMERSKRGDINLLKGYVINKVIAIDEVVDSCEGLLRKQVFETQEKNLIEDFLDLKNNLKE